MMVRRVFLAFLILGFAACSDSTGPTGPGPAVGTYTLRRINQQALPAKFDSEGPLGVEKIENGAPFLFEITAGSATLNEDWTCRISFTRRDTENGIVTTYTETDLCTYTIHPEGFRGLDMTFDDFWAVGSAPVTRFDSELTLGFGNVDPPDRVFAHAFFGQFYFFEK